MIDYSVLLKTGLFQGIKKEEAFAMLNCLGGREVTYKKGEFLCHEGESTKESGIVLSGVVHILKEDFFGNCNLVSVVGVGGIFGEVYATLGNEPLQVSIKADIDCQILYVDIGKVLRSCSNHCTFHQTLMENMVYSMARQSVFLTSRIHILTIRNTREKVLSYLSEQARLQDSNYVSIGLNRQQMADYLAVDRSALSKELARMKKDGLIEYDRNNFKLNRGKINGQRAL